MIPVPTAPFTYNFIRQLLVGILHSVISAYLVVQRIRLLGDVSDRAG